MEASEEGSLGADSLKWHVVSSKIALTTLSPASTSLAPGCLNCPRCSCTHLTTRPGQPSVPSWIPDLSLPPQKQTTTKSHLPVTLLIKILTGGQAFQRRELLVTVTETIPEKASFEEEMLSTLPDQQALKATLYLLAHLISQQHREGAPNILTL